MLPGLLRRSAAYLVSIRARPGGRAMRGGLAPRARRCMFQSAPGREAGRCDHLHKQIRAALVFQSAPGREAGRCRR